MAAKKFSKLAYQVQKMFTSAENVKGILFL